MTWFMNYDLFYDPIRPFMGEKDDLIRTDGRNWFEK